MALDRLLIEALLADALEQDRHRHLAFAEAGDLGARGEVVRGVLDGVMHVGARDLHRQADLVVRQFLDLGLHPAIQAEVF